MSGRAFNQHKVLLTQPHCIAETGDEEVPGVSPLPSLRLLLGRPWPLLLIPQVEYVTVVLESLDLLSLQRTLVSTLNVFILPPDIPRPLPPPP